ncbi:MULTISPECIES: hypothetical protein [Geobacillus]|uniref:hypothetical protein n=1 Tax=Geobacillus TaxID=129337 RepID=UPI000ACA209A|nr:hypothetical protein [[Bacillus] caldolyticus]
MGLEHLEQFLKQKKEERERKQLNREELKKQWLREIESFYRQIEPFLTPLQEKGLLSVKRENIKIQEELLGEYTTEKWQLHFPDQIVMIEPVGKEVIGANGRIDMIGKNETVKFLLVDQQALSPNITVSFPNLPAEAFKKRGLLRDKDDIEYAWKIATPPPNIRFLELNEDSFSDALLEVLVR